ncbi:MAG: Holliday junction branch migration protein RuvA [Deltaproteobacteria bacterium]|nr:Holliday junction branch migration protein RuvA [Candidatus Anaeroferrophillus wilburensis]MBN2888743.1 Holliday junction branch migration protein RuvA [Deltaproteobacteria bacterium]
MIARLAGTLIVKEPDQIIVDVAGVGYQLFIPAGTYRRLPPLEQQLVLWVTTRIRDDQFILYGFAAAEEQQMFLRLLSVAGVGPKLALNIISRIEPGQLEQMLINQDVALLTKIPGLGKKLSQRLALELGEELKKHRSGTWGQLPSPSSSGGETVRHELLRAMESLGFKPTDCLGMVDAALAKHPEGTLEELLKQVLKGIHRG